MKAPVSHTQRHEIQAKFAAEAASLNPDLTVVLMKTAASAKPGTASCNLPGVWREAP